MSRELRCATKPVSFLSRPSSDGDRGRQGLPGVLRKALPHSGIGTPFGVGLPWSNMLRRMPFQAWSGCAALPAALTTTVHPLITAHTSDSAPSQPYRSGADSVGTPQRGILGTAPSSRPTPDRPPQRRAHKHAPRQHRSATATPDDTSRRHHAAQSHNRYVTTQSDQPTSAHSHHPISSTTGAHDTANQTPHPTPSRPPDRQRHMAETAKAAGHGETHQFRPPGR